MLDLHFCHSDASPAGASDIFAKSTHLPVDVHGLSCNGVPRWLRSAWLWFCGWRRMNTRGNGTYTEGLWFSYQVDVWRRPTMGGYQYLTGDTHLDIRVDGIKLVRTLHGVRARRVLDSITAYQATRGKSAGDNL